ncbi:MAG: crossover junction endodeoxyribonuclease RuvC [Verrucomicrobiales bacterium]|jgi:crossover junction endodeoxyribonuclease RuvC
MRILSIDPALRNTGYAVIEQACADGRAPQNAKYRALDYGVVKNPPKLRPSSCLVEIRQQLLAVIEKHQPEVCAIEAVIYVQSFKTAITMGAARGAALMAAAEHGMAIHEYAPKRVKQAVVGRGGATKDQVAFMMRALLGLTETPPSDAADAMAIGMTHFYTKDTAEMLGKAPAEI